MYTVNPPFTQLPKDTFHHCATEAQLSTLATLGIFFSGMCSPLTWRVQELRGTCRTNHYTALYTR